MECWLAHELPERQGSTGAVSRTRASRPSPHLPLDADAYLQGGSELAGTRDAPLLDRSRQPQLVKVGSALNTLEACFQFMQELRLAVIDE